MADKREINGVFMIPFGLAAGFADGIEIRLIELAENGFCFRTEKELGRVESFRICFYGGSEVLVEAFEIEMRIDDSIGIPVFVYSVFVDQQEYRECAAKLILQYDRYVRLKLECEDGELAKVLTDYPAELDTEFAEDLEEQKKEWFGEVRDASGRSAVRKHDAAKLCLRKQEKLLWKKRRQLWNMPSSWIAPSSMNGISLWSFAISCHGTGEGIRQKGLENSSRRRQESMWEMRSAIYCFRKRSCYLSS